MSMIRTVTTALLLLAAATGAAAQAPSAQRPPGNVTSAPPVSLEVDARTTREQLQELMQRYPPDLGRVLKLDPTLLRNEAYLAQYPALAAFLRAHPEVANNSAYYLQFIHIDRDEWQPVDARTESIRMYRNMMDGIGAFAIFAGVSALIAWFVRTFIDYRRWLRVSKVQTEVHNKLLERFSGTGDLLAYVQSPAGRRFLESAPIPLDPGPRSLGAPLSRILWSVQAGVVFTILGLGFELVSRRVIEDVGQPLSVFGVLGMALGIGFIASGAVSYILSRRLGLLDSLLPLPPASERHDSPTP
jgi:hypothetical protein